MKLHVVISTSCLSAGEALRLMDQKDMIKSDFVLVGGDVIANLDLKAIIAAHKQRRIKDRHAIMTMVCHTLLSSIVQEMLCMFEAGAAWPAYM